MVSSRAIVSTTLLAVSTAEQWAVLVAGSDGWTNYRHQADVCHAYHVVSQTLPDERIIVMMKDDVADSHYNHDFPGQLFNKPTPAGTPGVDVRKNCMIDYKGDDVTPENFLGVLRGNTTGKKLESGKDDEVFIYFADHGAPGLISFPPDYADFQVRDLYKAELQSAIDYMHKQQMFKKLVFYLETCESGSMFEGMNTPGVYALSAAAPDQTSQAIYCGDDATVDGKAIRTSCLGDAFSTSWMERADATGTQESLESEYTAVKKLVTGSSVMQWGDLSFKTDSVSEFLGDVHGNQAAATPVHGISVREIHLKWAYDQYLSASSADERLAAGEILQQTLDDQLAAEMAYEQFLEIVYPDSMEKRAAARLSVVPANLPECEETTRKSFGKYGKFDSSTAFSLQFHRYIVNVCADLAKSGSNVDLAEAARLACSVPSTIV